MLIIITNLSLVCLQTCYVISHKVVERASETQNRGRFMGAKAVQFSPAPSRWLYRRFTI